MSVERYVFFKHQLVIGNVTFAVCKGHIITYKAAVCVCDLSASRFRIEPAQKRVVSHIGYRQ